MKFNRQNKQNKLAKTIRLNKVSVFSVLVLASGILFLGRPELIKLSWAANEAWVYPPKAQPAKNNKAAPKTAEVVNQTCMVNGIFYDQDHPRVLINDELFSTGSYCCGGKITGIFADFVVLEFPYGKRDYKLGNIIRIEKTKAEPAKLAPEAVASASEPVTPAAEPAKPAPGTQTSYVNKVNSLVEGFMAGHNQNNSLLDMQMKKNLFTDQDEASQIRVRAGRMLELIQEKKQELGGISAPDGCKRHYHLTTKLFDIAEDGWKAVLAGNKDRAEVFFDRLLKVYQEISQESVSILARR